MAYWIDLPTHDDERGSLTVIEKLLPFDLKRVYYMYNVHGQRGGHRHKVAIQALVCVHGSCQVNTNNGIEANTYILDQPDKLLIVEPQDWHTMNHFDNEAVLLVFASEYYDRSDYIDEDYPS